MRNRCVWRVALTHFRNKIAGGSAKGPHPRAILRRFVQSISCVAAPSIADTADYRLLTAAEQVTHYVDIVVAGVVQARKPESRLNRLQE